MDKGNNIKHLYLKDTSFANLMQKRIFNVLLVASYYDAFILEEDGRVEEQIFFEYTSLNLSSPPRVTQVNNLEDAFKELSTKRFDLIIAIPDAEHSQTYEKAKEIKHHYPDIPIVLLTPFAREVSRRLEKEDLRQAIRDAAKKGKTVKEDAFTFSGDEAETYEGLFEEGNLYELHPDFEKKNDRLTLKMYARLEDEEDMDQYTISGNEEIIFLMTNSSSKERTGRILVDGRASAWMTVAPFGEVKKQVGLETEEAVPVEIENEVKEPESAVQEVKISQKRIRLWRTM